MSTAQTKGSKVNTLSRLLGDRMKRGNPVGCTPHEKHKALWEYKGACLDNFLVRDLQCVSNSRTQLHMCTRLEKTKINIRHNN